MSRLAAVILLALGVAPWCRASAQVHPDSAPTPAIEVTGPTVIAFWLVPASDSVLEADEGLASALDQQRYYWAETRPRLEAAGISAFDQPGRRFRVREPGREWVFAAEPDSAEIGYLLVRPGRPAQVLYRLQYPDELLASARAFFGTAKLRQRRGDARLPPR